MRDLIGWQCRVEFIDKAYQPFHGSGWPVLLNVLAVDTPMVKVQSLWGAQEKWLNLSQIATIEAVERMPRKGA